MPHISVTLYPGRTQEVKKEIATKLNACLVEACGWRPEDISVSFAEIPAENFVQQVTEKIDLEELVLRSDYISKNKGEKKQ